MDKDTIATIRNELASLRKEVEELRNKRVTQDQILPDSIKMRAVGEGVRYVRGGVTASRPTSGEEPLQGQAVYFDTTLGKLSIWNGSSWVDFVRVPSSLTVLTQTYATAQATLANNTFTAVSETGVTQTTPWGFATEAQGNSVLVELNDLADDVADVKQFVNSLVDALQSAGIVS